MKIENQICLPEQAIRLKELGIIQDSYFYFVNGKIVQSKEKEAISAFTSAELTRLLPCSIYSEEKSEWYYFIQRDNSILYISNKDVVGPREHWKISKYDGWKFVCEAHAKAEILIIILENYQLPLNECNERLITNI